jgi:hypothetical protein
MNTCQTSVSVDDADGKWLGFFPCGKPVTRTESIGSMRCGYCDEHAAAARRFVEEQGQAAIAAIQQRVR